MSDKDLSQALIDWSVQLYEIHKQYPDMLEMDGPGDLPENVQLDIRKVYDGLLKAFTDQVSVPRNVALACIERALEKTSIDGLGKMGEEQALEATQIALKLMVRAKVVLDGVLPNEDP